MPDAPNDPDALRPLTPEEELAVDAWMAEHPEFVRRILELAKRDVDSLSATAAHDGPDATDHEKGRSEEQARHDQE